MKRKIALIFLGTVLICTGILSGCQKTPEDDIVVNKGDEWKDNQKVEEAVQEDEDSPYTTKHQSDTFVCTKSGVKFIVDADVDEIHSMPIVRTRPHQIAPEEVRHWAKILFGDAKAYEPKIKLSKSEIESEILKYRQLSNEEALYEIYGDEESVQEMQQYYQEEIDALEKQYASAPETVEKKETDWIFRPSAYYFADDFTEQELNEYDYLKNTYQIKIVSLEDSTGHLPMIAATNRDESDYKVNILHFYYKDENEMTDFPNVQLSEDEALQMADKLLEELHLDAWRVCQIEKDDEDGKSSYCLTYSPEYLDVPVLLCPEVDLHAEDSYAANYYYSELEVRICNGIILAVSLTSPLDTVEILNETANVLPFDDIYQHFKSQMENVYSEKTALENEIGMTDAEVTFNISKIDQGLFRIKEKNNENDFLMVPAYRFIGEMFVNGDMWGEMELCYINALDGSIIDPAVGY